MVREIFENGILNPPIFPFIGLSNKFPLLVLSWIELPYHEGVERWIEEDPHIFAAFRSRHAEYNTLLILYHKDIKSHQEWREQVIAEKRFPLLHGSYPKSSTSFFSSQLLIKYEPNAPIYLLEEELRRRGYVLVDGYRLKDISFKISKLLAEGKCIRANESKLSKELGIHRKTVIRLISSLIENKWVSNPVCRFPSFFTPPGYILAICKMEIKSSKQEFVKDIRDDPHVTLAFDIKEGGYDILLFGAFKSLEEELEWEVKKGLYLSRSIGKVDIQYFSPKHFVNVNNTKVSLGILDENFMYFRA